MKKNRLLSLFLALVMLFGLVSALGGSAMAADVAINATNFPDANFRNFVKQYDKNNYGYLSDAELAAVTTMYCSDKNISDLKGIEYFTALKTFFCDRNQLTKLDVSRNTALTHLDCSQNQMTSLDVSRNTALTVLNCSENKLTSLDVRSNTALTDINCHHNKLTRLDMSRNTALTVLDCHHNQLTNLDISSNTALTNLICSSNQLTKLDVRSNTALTYLDCSFNQLTSLDVSHNTALELLDCQFNQLTSLDVSRNTALTTLECGVNKLTSLDVGRNTALTDLSCNHNQLTSLDVSRNTALTKLSCNSNQLTSLDVRSNTALTRLNCSENMLMSLDVRSNIALTWLSCWDNQLTSLDVGAVPAIRDAVVNGIKDDTLANIYDYKSDQGELYVDETVTIVTVQPTLTGTAAINPSNPKVGDTMMVYLSGIVWTVPSSNVNYFWQADTGSGRFSDVSTRETYTIPASVASGTRYRVIVTANGYSGSVYSDPVTVVKPALTGQVTISPSNPNVGDTLNASIRISNGGYSGRTLCQWQRSVGSSDFENIPGATGDTYKPVQDDAGKKIRLAVFNNNYDGYIFSEPVTVAKDPTGLYGTVTVSPSNPKAGDKLTSSLSGDVAGISVRNLKYQWQQSTNTGSFSNIRQATSSSYTVPSSAPDGRQYRLTVTATGYTGTLYSNTVTVGGSSFEKGDVDRSGQVGNSDLIMVARHVVHIITLSGEQFTLGDMNDDKVIDNKDIITLAKKIVGM